MIANGVFTLCDFITLLFTCCFLYFACVVLFFYFALCFCIRFCFYYIIFVILLFPFLSFTLIKLFVYYTTFHYVSFRSIKKVLWARVYSLLEFTALSISYPIAYAIAYLIARTSKLQGRINGFLFVFFSLFYYFSFITLKYIQYKPYNKSVAFPQPNTSDVIQSLALFFCLCFYIFLFKRKQSTKKTHNE